MVWARIGGFFYVLWGLMHVMFGVQILQQNITQSTHAVVESMYQTVGPVGTPNELGPVISALMNQHGWNLLWFGLFAAFVGAFYNWRNSLAGYWSNLAVVSLADIGFIVAVLVPGYVSWTIGISGPLLWILAALFSTLGIRQRNGA